ncbi:MAG: CRTAC1 family protein [Pseudomonadota bacterium]
MRLSALPYLLSATFGAAEPVFEPVAVPAHAYTGGWEHFVGGGVAVFDCDGDHRPELYVAGGEATAALFRNQDQSALAFDIETPKALSLTGVTGAYPLDIDGDSWLDLAVLRVGENLLMRGLPDCGFEPFDELGFASADRWTTAFSATWESDADLPTLAFGNYVDRTHPEGPFEACDDNALYRPMGDGYSAPSMLQPGFCALSMLFTDWGGNGRADLRISNDRHYYVSAGHEQLWAMERTPRLFTEEEGWLRHKLWGMGIAARDMTGDGRAEVMLSSMGDQRMQSLESGGKPTFRDVPFGMGTTAHRPYTGGDGRPSTGWHIAFGDVQNDGRDDIFIAKGNVDQMPGLAMDDPNNLLIQQEDGRFIEFGESAGLASLHRARGAAMVDLDLDGRLDIVVVNRRANVEVFRNVTDPVGNHLSVLLQQGNANSHAVGAVIELRTNGRVQTREITVGGGHVSGDVGPAHFGLGPATQVQLRVTWPSGNTSAWHDVASNQALVVRPAGSALDITPY